MISRATVSFVQSLKQKKYRQKYNKFLVEGEKIILEGLQQKFISFDTIFCLEEKEALLQDIKINYNVLDRRTMAKLSSLKTPPGILAVANIPTYDFLPEELTGITLFLENLNDPGNMGTIIRTADWFGVKTILATKESVDFYNPKVIQATMGSFSRVRLINVEISALDMKIPIYSTSMKGESIYDFTAPEQMILVIGNESHGVSREVMSYSKGLLSIPRARDSKAESLNAGVATAIFLSHLVKFPS